MYIKEADAVLGAHIDYKRSNIIMLETVKFNLQTSIWALTPIRMNNSNFS